MKNALKCFGFAFVFTITSVISTSTNADVIAELFDDFAAPANTGWSYLWNPAGVTIGDGANYIPIPVVGSNYTDSTTPVAVGTAGGNGNYLDLRVAGATPSLRVISGLDAGVATAPGDGIDHYAILRYTIQPGEAGDVTFDSTRFGLGNNGNTIAAYKNDVFVNSITATGNTAINFNFGAVNVGDTLDIAVLTPDNGASRNARRIFISTSFDHEFNREIPAIPEPSSLALFGLTALGLVTRRRR